MTDRELSKRDFVTHICLFSKWVDVAESCSYVGDGHKNFVYHLRNNHRDNPQAQKVADELDLEITKMKMMIGE